VVVTVDYDYDYVKAAVYIRHCELRIAIIPALTSPNIVRRDITFISLNINRTPNTPLEDPLPRKLVNKTPCQFLFTKSTNTHSM